MKKAKATYYYLWPVAIIGLGWLWHYIGYRLVFHGNEPDYGFFRRPGGNKLRLWLFEIPTYVVLLSMLLHVVLASRRLLREKQWVAAAVYLAICLVLTFIYLGPVSWFIWIPGHGEFLI